MGMSHEAMVESGLSDLSEQIGELSDQQKSIIAVLEEFRDGINALAGFATAPEV